MRTHGPKGGAQDVRNKCTRINANLYQAESNTVARSVSFRLGGCAGYTGYLVDPLRLMPPTLQIF